jgi:hypothetical protein
VRPEEDGIEFATWAPERANQRKRTVPTNSPVMAMKWLRMESGTLLRKGRRRSSWVSSALVLLAFVQGIARPLPWRGVCEVSMLVSGWRLVDVRWAYVDVHRGSVVGEVCARALEGVGVGRPSSNQRQGRRRSINRWSNEQAVDD